MENFTSALGSFAAIKHSERAAFGFTTVKRDISVTASDGHTTSSRKYVSSEEYTALGNVGVEMSMPLDDPRGINVGVVGEGGSVTDELFLNLMRKYGSVSRPTLIDMAAEVDEYIWEDSHLALLVALLSLYYTKRAVETGAVQDISDYNDGHIKVSGKDLLVPPPTATDWRAEDVVASAPWIPTTIQAPPTHSVISLYGFKQEEANVVMTLLAGKVKTTQFAFDLEMPELIEKVLVVGTGLDFERAKEDVKSSTVLSALNKYVMRHRLEATFQAALHMMLQVAVNPVPDTAEGLAWLKRKRNLRLPQFKAWRAAYRPLMLDEPFGYDAGVASTWRWWKDMLLSTVAVGAAYNALSLWGRYFVEAGYYDDEADVGRLGHHYLADNPGAAYYSYAALITGHETVVEVPAGYGLEFEPWSGEDDFRLGVTVLDLQDAGYNLEISDDKEELLVKELPPPCSTIHVLGKMPATGMYSTLASSYKLSFDRVSSGWLFPNVAQAWGFGMVTRWLGYDTEMTYEGVRRRGNWAANNTGVAARPFSVKGPDLLGVVVNSVAPREKVFRSLPSMGNNHCEWHIQVAVSDSCTVLSLRGGRVRAEGAVRLTKAGGQQKVYVPIGTEVAYAPVRMIAMSRAQPTSAGFQEIDPTTRIKPPEPSGPVGPSVLAETAEGEADDEE